MMKDKNIATLIMLKIICCGLLMFFLLGGISLLAGLGTGSIVLSSIGISIILWGVYRLIRVIQEKQRQV